MKRLVVLAVIIFSLSALMPSHEVAASGGKGGDTPRLTAHMIFIDLPSLESKYFDLLGRKGVLSPLTHQPLLTLEFTKRALHALAKNPKVIIELRNERR